MRFRPDQERERIPRLDMTSMVDLVFLLIIFFLTTSSFIERTKADLSLPEDRTVLREQVSVADRSSVVVNITRNGTIIVSREYLTLDQLVSKIEAEIARSGGPEAFDLVVRADRDAPLLYVNEVAERLIALGLPRWKLAARVAAEEPPSGGAP